MPTLNLPRDVVADPRNDAVVDLFTTNTARLWEKGTIEIPTLPWTAELSNVCKEALANGLAAQGLEGIAKTLAREQKGLDALLAKAPDKPQSPRISRFLILSNDGSPRFYRDCDALLTTYETRVLGCRFDIAGEALGEAVLGRPDLVRAVLVTDKKAVARVLFALVAPKQDPAPAS